jgi:hypothetical protein
MKFTPLLIAAVMLPNFTSALAVPASDDTHTDADVATIQSTNGEIELRQIGTWCKPGTYTCEDPWRIKWVCVLLPFSRSTSPPLIRLL